MTKIGVGTVALGGVPVVSAHEHSEEEFAEGHSVNCYFSPDNTFDLIYNDVKGWENSKVWLSHSKWEEDVILRVGNVARISNSTVHSHWDDEDDADNDPLMVAGNWPVGENNIWKPDPDKGRINDAHCYSDKDVAYKYWFHEIGHAHGLHHRDELGGQLMDSGDLDAMHLNETECQTWKDAYSASTATQSSEGSKHDDGHDHGGQVICSPPPEKSENNEENVENQNVTRVTVRKKEGL